MNIEAERARLGKNKEEMSRILGISSKTYLAYIRNKPIPSNVLEKMAQVFDCSADYLLHNTTDKPAS